jgi:hypothetical protein
MTGSENSPYIFDLNKDVYAAAIENGPRAPQKRNADGYTIEGLLAYSVVTGESPQLAHIPFYDFVRANVQRAYNPSQAGEIRDTIENQAREIHGVLGKMNMFLVLGGEKHDLITRDDFDLGEGGMSIALVETVEPYEPEPGQGFMGHLPQIKGKIIHNPVTVMRQMKDLEDQDDPSLSGFLYRATETRAFIDIMARYSNVITEVNVAAKAAKGKEGRATLIVGSRAVWGFMTGMYTEKPEVAVDLGKALETLGIARPHDLSTYPKDVPKVPNVLYQEYCRVYSEIPLPPELAADN